MKIDIKIEVNYLDIMKEMCLKMSSGEIVDTDTFICKSIEDSLSSYFKDKLNVTISEKDIDRMVKEINLEFKNFRVESSYSSLVVYLLDDDMYLLPEGEF